VTTTVIDDFAGTNDVYVGEVQVTEEEEGSSGQIILYLLIIFIILILIIVGYIFYKRRQVSNVQTKVHDIGRRKHKKQARHQESDIPNILANAESADAMEGMPVSKPLRDQEGHPQDARFDTNQSMERVAYGTTSKNNSHRKMV